MPVATNIYKLKYGCINCVGFLVAYEHTERYSGEDSGFEPRPDDQLSWLPLLWFSQSFQADVGLLLHIRFFLRAVQFDAP